MTPEEWAEMDRKFRLHEEWVKKNERRMTDEEILRQRVSEETTINRVLSARLEKAERALKDISELYGEDCSLARTIANRYFGTEGKSK